jgi:hypothetical protein
MYKWKIVKTCFHCTTCNGPATSHQEYMGWYPDTWITGVPMTVRCQHHSYTVSLQTKEYEPSHTSHFTTGRNPLLKSHTVAANIMGNRNFCKLDRCRVCAPQETILLEHSGTSQQPSKTKSHIFITTSFTNQVIPIWMLEEGVKMYIVVQKLPHSLLCRSSITWVSFSMKTITT